MTSGIFKLYFQIFIFKGRKNKTPVTDMYSQAKQIPSLTMPPQNMSQSALNPSSLCKEKSGMFHHDACVCMYM